MESVATLDQSVVSITGPDTLDLAFELPAETEGMARDQFLVIHGSRGSLSAKAPLSGREGSAGTPARFALHQNRPNPFAKSTTFHFDLPIASSVKLEVFDVQGRSLARPVDGEYEAGPHRVTWAASTGPGLYFVRFSAAGRVITRRVILLR